MKHTIRLVFIFFNLLLIGQHLSLAQSGDNQSNTLSRVESLLNDFDSLYTIEPVRARGLIDEALLTSKNNGFTLEYADSYLRLGKLHFIVGRYDSAKLTLEKALQIYNQISNQRGIAHCYKDLGNVNIQTGNLGDGLSYYTKGLNLAQAHQLEDLVILFIGNIGRVYLDQNHFDKAQAHFEESAAISKKGFNYAIAINNIGMVKQKQGKHDEAIVYFKKSLEACQAAGDEYCSIFPLSGMAGTYLFQQDLGLAMEVNEKITAVQEKLGLEKDLMVSYNRMGLIYSQKGQFDLAIYYLYKSLSIARKLNSGLIHYIHSNLSEAHANNGQYEEALKHTILFYEIKDSIYSVDYKLKTEELLKKYENEKSEKEIALLKKNRRLREIEMENKQAQYTKELLKKNLEEEKNKYMLLHKNREIGFLKKDSELQQVKIKNKQAELEKQTFIRNVTIISAILIFIPTFILMVVYQQKVRDKELLVQKTEEVNKQKTLELLRSFEIKTIKATIEGQEKEKQRLAKELHDGVAGSLAGIKMRFQTLGALLDENEQLKKLMGSVDEVYKEVRTISHHLTPPGMLQYSFVGFIKKYLDEISQVSNFDIEFIYHGETDLNLLSDDVKVEIYRILQELITNSIKHAHADLVEVQLNKQSEGVNLIVEDRGKGFDVALKSAGLGLGSIRSRVDALGGQLNIDSVPRRGTIVHVEIPLS